MKGTALIALFAIAVTALSPFSAFTASASVPGEPMLRDLDVCSSASPAVSPAGAMPCIASSVFLSLPVVHVTKVQHPSPLFTELILSTVNEQPPRS